jgi:hypothetical protein
VSYWLAGVLGIALIFGGILAYLQGHGVLEDFRRMMTGFMPGYTHSALQDAFAWHNLAREGAFLRVHLLLLLGLPALVGAVRRGSVETRSLLAWLGLAALADLGQGRFFAYQLLTLAAGLAAFAGAGVLMWWSWPQAGSPGAGARRTAWRVALVILIVGDTGALWSQLQRRVAKTEMAALVGRASEAQVYEAAGMGAQVAAADYLRAHTRPGDAIYQLGNQPQLYWLSDRAPASRFAGDMPLVVPWAPPEYRDICMRELTLRRPTAVVIVSPDTFVYWVPTDTYGEVRKWPEFGAWLARDYALATRIAPYDIYLRKQ